MEGKASDWRPGPTVCRCCLTEGCYKDISTEYFWMGKREVYAEMLSETLNVSIAYSKSGGPNSNSRLICEPCISRLRDASEFKRQVIDCEKTFMHHLDPGSSSKNREVDSISEVKMELKHEKEANSDNDFDDRPDFLDIDTDDDLDDQPLTKLVSKIPKKESEELLNLLDTSQITVKRKSNLKLKAPPKKIVKKKEVVAKPSASKPVATKQAEKKKDEWTTTDAPDKLTHCKSPDEWITTECEEAIRNEINVDTDRGPNERVTKDFAHTVKIEITDYESEVDDKWIVTDARTKGKKTVIAKASIEKVPEKSKIELVSDRNIQITQLNNVEASITRDKVFWTHIDKKEVKVIVSGANTADSCPKRIRRIDKKKVKVIVSGAEIADSRPKRDRRFVNKKFLENARLLVKHTTAIPIRIQLSSIDVTCFVCSSKFEDPFLFRDHFLAEHKSVDKTKGMHLYNNVQTRVDITDLACAECTQSFDTLEAVAEHLIQVHKIGIDLGERLGLVPLKFPHVGQYICAVCPRKCLSFRDLYRHSGSHFPMHVCEICGKKFESTPSLRSHISCKHVEGHPCRHCKAEFASDQELRLHVKSGCTGFKCKICKMTFPYSQPLQKHRETVHGAPKRVYKCAECLIVFEKRMQLYYHANRAHTDHHKCHHCGKPFTDSSSLKRHMLVHTDERPYKCHICQQAFKNRSYYKTHIGKCKV